MRERRLAAYAVGIIVLVWLSGILFGYALAADASVRGGVQTIAPTPVLDPYPAGIEGDLQGARDYWGSEPLGCASTSVEIVALPPDRWGEATLPPPNWRGPCVMRVAPDLEPWYQCLVVVHEFGHWLSVEHNGDQTSPMYERGPYWATIPQCDGRRAP